MTTQEGTSAIYDGAEDKAVYRDNGARISLETHKRVRNALMRVEWMGRIAKVCVYSCQFKTIASIESEEDTGIEGASSGTFGGDRHSNATMVQSCERDKPVPVRCTLPLAYYSPSTLQHYSSATPVPHSQRTLPQRLPRDP